jgi:hypothetical protein
MILLALAACGGEGGGHAAQDQAYADDAVALLDSIDVESAVLAPLVDDAEPGALPEDVAAFALGRLATSFSPAGCATATQDGATLEVTFADCSGPFAIAGLSGALTAIYGRAGDGGLELIVLAPALVVGARTYELHATGSYTQTGAQRRLSVVTNSVVKEGFHRGGNYVATWDEGAACKGLAGVWTAMQDQLSFFSQASDLVRCAGGCPASGGQLVFTISGGEDRPRELTIDFEGGPQASWSADDGESGSVAVPCGG